MRHPVSMGQKAGNAERREFPAMLRLLHALVDHAA
jgi:hypothetical protein